MMKKKKVIPRARARAKGVGGGSRRRRSEVEKNEEKEAFSSLCDLEMEEKNHSFWFPIHV